MRAMRVGVWDPVSTVTAVVVTVVALLRLIVPVASEHMAAVTVPSGPVSYMFVCRAMPMTVH
jgi:hypothetical protein